MTRLPARQQPRMTHIKRAMHSFVSVVTAIAFSTLIPVAAQTADPADTEALIAQLNEQREALATMQQEQGTFGQNSDDMLALLQSLTDTLLQARAEGEALDALDQQLQIIKVHDGLYSEAQIPVLLQIVDVLAGQRKWEEVSDRLDYIHWMLPRAPEMPLETKLTVLQQTDERLRFALLHGPREREARYLLQLREQREQALELALDAGNTEQIDALQYDLALAELYIGLAMVTTTDTSQALINEEHGIPSTTPLRPLQRITSVSDLETMYGSRTTTVIERAHRSAMTRHYQLIEEIGERQSEKPEVQAMLKLYLGDSVLLRQQYELRTGTLISDARGSNNIGNAATYYRDAWALFKEAGYSDSELNAYFACPALLPLQTLSLELTTGDSHCEITGEDALLTINNVVMTESALPAFAYEELPQTQREMTTDGVKTLLEFRIGVNGQAENIDIVDATPDTTGARIQGRDALRSLQFRPVLIDGEAQRRQNVRLTLISLNQD
jgi:hypothetical protein